MSKYLVGKIACTNTHIITFAIIGLSTAGFML